MLAQTHASEMLFPKRIVAVHYPRFANLTGVQGSVILVATVAPDGTVQSIRSKTPVNPFTESAKAALTRWLFSGCTPGSGVCEITIKFLFALDGPSCNPGSDCQEEFRIDLPDKVEVRARPMHAFVN